MIASPSQSNIQKLEPDVLRKRLSFTYACALVCFRHYAEFWHGAAMVHADYGDEHGDEGATEQARATFLKGIEALPGSLLLTFAYADWEEAKRKFPAGFKAFDALLEANPCPLAFVQYLTPSRRSRFCRFRWCW